MKKYITLALAALLFAACADSEEQLRQRAAELCPYIPDHELKEGSEQFLTADFYAVLDTMFNHLPDYEAMDHEWLYYFVTGNGGTIADYEVADVQLTDDSHAIATIKVRQKWEDGSFDENSDVEEHKLSMQLVDGQWLMSDFDDHKKDCLHAIAQSHQEQAMRQAMSDYLVSQIGSYYLQGQHCIPTLLIAATEETAPDEQRVWCDCWVWWYDVAGDTLKTVSGGNHAGCMTLRQQGGKPVVTAFEQTVDGAGNEASAKRIFGTHYDTFRNITQEHVRNAARKEQLQWYVRQHLPDIHYYQDYGWEAVEL